jgi:hypothetical protein
MRHHAYPSGVGFDATFIARTRAIFTFCVMLIACDIASPRCERDRTGGLTERTC